MNCLITLLILVLTFSVGTTRLNAQNVNIPDANFKAYLLGNTIINTNGDTEIQITEAANYTSSMNCYSLNISDLTGIEAFPNLEVLNCALNNLTSLDLSQNTALTEVICESNNLTSLILPTTGNLFIIECRFNQITTLDLSQVPSVSVLNAEGSGLYNLDLRNGNNTYFSNTSFNVTNNPNLSCINVDDAAYSTANWTNIDAGASFSTNCTAPPALVNIPDANFKTYLVGNTAINTNGNTEIEVSEAAAFVGTIDCSSQNIVELTGIEEFVNLTVLDCSSNNLTSLDLSQNTSLTSLDCSSNNLSSLNVKNNNNTNFTTFDATNNSGLSCIEVDAIAYSTTNWTNIDAGTSFSTNCVPPVVNIPDANFKTNLLNNTAINTNGDGEIQVTEATAFTGTINCSSTGLINVTGLEAFVNLTGFTCTNNAQLLSLDVSQNINLLTLDCSNNYQLSSLSANNNLQTLTCTGTDMYGIFVSNITGLVTLNCSSNNISNLDVSQNTNLVNLNCSHTDITTLDLSNNPNLEVFQCDFNNLTSLDVRNGNNTIITNFQVNFGSLSCVDVDNPAYSTANWTNVDAGTLFSTSCSGPALVNIPDANFKAYLVGNTAINTNGDAEIQVSEAVAFGGAIDCSRLSIADLTGIEAFVNLTELDCETNSLNSLNVTQNTSLTSLNCSGNNLGSLDVTQNVNLTFLDLDHNNLSSLGLTQNTSLITLYCSDNDLTNLDLDQNINLTDIDCRNNNFTSLDFSQNVNLTTLTCTHSNLRSIDVSQNVNLEYLSCIGNELASLDVSQNVNLKNLDCRYNPITNLDLTQNVNLVYVVSLGCNLSGFDIRNGNNTNLTLVHLTGNANLSCINVDDVAYSTLNWTNIDAGASFSTNCTPPIVNIPDANFKANLVGNPAINTNGDTEIQISEASAFTGTINCSNANISDLTGVAAFPNLTVLNCNHNNLIYLDLTFNTGLEELYCTNNNLKGFTRHYYLVTPDLIYNVNLKKLDCSFNPMRILNLTQNTDLVEVVCESCNLHTVDVKNGNNTNVTVFNLLNNPNLNCINVDDAAYSTTNWTNLDAGTSFDGNCSPAIVNIPDANLKSYLVGWASINTNGDGEIQYSETRRFSSPIDCSNMGITDMTGIEAFYSLGELYCQNNNISNLDLTQNYYLRVLNCVNNNLSNLDVTENSSMKWLYCASNPLTSLDVTKNSRLEKLYAGTSQLTSLDLNQNHSLFVLDCASAQLSTLTLKNGNNTSMTTFKVTNNPNLSCIEVDNPTYSTANWTNIDATASFSTNCNVPNAVVYIPDVNFKAYLVGNTAINTNGDAEIQVSEASAFSGAITCPSLTITNLLGIEAFENVTSLDCSSNALTSININQNTSLTVLDCSTNNLNNLSLSQNTSLTTLNCSSNNLSTLDVSQNTSLTNLDCSGNNLGALEVNLNTSLTALNCSSNNLSNLELKNGNNTNITIFDATSNPNLGCIDVDDAAYATTNWTSIDATASFSVNCSAQNVYIPDATFKAILISNTAINTSGDNEIQFSEAAAFTGTINCSANSITDLTGIEAFVNLNQLRCYRNNLTSLDLSQNTSLTQLYCYNNQISSINLSQNTNLVLLHCVNNSISNIDLTQNTNLTTLYCSNNPMYNLDLSQNTSLRVIDCASNQLSSLDVKNGNNTNVTTFRATGNPLLTCINVDDVAHSTANWTSIDASASFNLNCSSVAPVVYIPNANFKAYLVGNTAINTDGDSEIQFSEAAAFTGKIDCYNISATSLVGVEEFINLTELDCSFNNIGSLDLTQNVNLEWLDYSGTGLMSLDLSQNTALKTLLCASIATTSSLLYLDVSHNVNLESLSCDNNALTVLDLTQNTSLTTLYCYANQITSLDLSQNTNLTILNCSYNEITSLDISQNTNLVNFSCVENQLTSLDAKNGNNTIITFFGATMNQNLTCIKVDDVAYSTTNWTNIDATASFDANCIVADPIVNIPDANFKAYLVGNTAINSNGDTEIQLSEATAFSGVVNCPNSSIADLTGIEAFVNVTQLKCYNNSLSSLDVSQNTNLVVLHCVNNSVSNLDLSQNTSLTQLFCSNNPISSLDVSQSTNLKKLYCGLTQITNLDVTQNTSLTVLDCTSSALSSLSVKNGNNTNFTTFKATNNPNLSCIEVDNPTYSTANWTNVDATSSFNSICIVAAPIVNIPDANFKAYLVANTAINTDGDAEIQVTEAAAFSGVINCPNSNITDLTGIEAFVNLTQLKCYNNNLGSLDVSQNTSLTWIHCVNSGLSSLDVSQNTSLIWLYCSNNPINSLDLTQNTNLTKLYCSGAQLTTLTIKNGNNTNMATFKVTNNPNLTCIGVDDVAYSTANWTDIDAVASFSTACVVLAPTVNIPDANFKAYLVGNTAINTDGDAEIQVSEATAFSGAIDCSNLNIAVLTGIEAFENLTTLNCSSNTIGSLDLTQNSSLTSVDCSSNQLNNLTVKNGNNTNVTYFDARSNSILGCIEVDNGAYSTTNWTNIDATASFSANCGAPTVNIPDANFKAYLVGNSAINTDGDGEIQVTEATAFSGVINCPGSNIADLTGIEAFVNVTQLKCYNNNISSLDLSQNTSLTWLHCVKNSISSLDLSQNTSLTWLYCSNNPIGNLDLTQNTSLTRLYGSATQLNSLTIKNGNNTAITTFQVTNNPNLTCIEVDDVAYSTANWADIDAVASFNTSCILPMMNGSNVNEGIQGSGTLTNISSINKAINLSAYPNPATKEITLDFGKSYEEATIQVSNLTGQIVLSKTLTNSAKTTLELEGPTGIYFVSIQTEKGKATLKVIKE